MSNHGTALLKQEAVKKILKVTPDQKLSHSVTNEIVMEIAQTIPTERQTTALKEEREIQNHRADGVPMAIALGLLLNPHVIDDI
ncbi:MAG TPA: hypothetical protein PKD34_03460 [Candidatus Doudnabacteria bacterium]|nr:hypothetical protein [Candidatus Doudnabacteria bacterium]